MFRTCPATGHVQCHFDRETHQCKCGRWQRGFAPAKVLVKPRAECQICERKQALDADGKLGNHGYKRPGWGFIVGNCPGVNHLPFPATDALVSYLTRCEGFKARTEEALVALPLATELTVTVTRTVGRYPDDKKESKDVVLVKGEPDHRNTYFPGDWSIPSFTDVQRRRIAKEESELRYVIAEIARVEARIVKGRALRIGMPLLCGARPS